MNTYAKTLGGGGVPFRLKCTLAIRYCAELRTLLCFTLYVK